MIRLTDHKMDKPVVAWLITGAIMVFIMVLIGGVTRLTGSGLSMVEWNVIMGSVPPMSDVEWQETFEKYQQFPQYKLVNQDMTVEEFKGIFFWEYFHRMWGRLIGIVFIVPFVIFIIQKRFDRLQLKKLGVLLVLGGAQGGIGWFMVKSGLVDQPNVSHIRLAIHLSMALFLLAYIYRLIFEYTHQEEDYKLVKNEYFDSLKVWSNLSLIILSIQIMYGAFMAGLKAYIYAYTYPMIQGTLIPKGLFSYDGFLVNFIENPLMVNFMHRWVPILLGLAISMLMVKAWKSGLKPLLKKNLMGIMIVYTIQFLLGVITLMTVPKYDGHVHVHLGVTHQATAVLLLTFTLFNWFQVKKLSQIKD